MNTLICPGLFLLALLAFGSQGVIDDGDPHHMPRRQAARQVLAPAVAGLCCSLMAMAAGIVGRSLGVADVDNVAAMGCSALTLLCAAGVLVYGVNYLFTQNIRETEASALKSYRKAHGRPDHQPTILNLKRER